MLYPKTDFRSDFPKMENEVLSYWREKDIFHKSLKQTESGKPFSFYDGPPFGNGLPHWGHLGVSAVKDMVLRYQTMNGKYVVRELGWDCHGLPAENSVEKKQGKQAKDIVASTSMQDFCDMCRADVQTYTKEWEKFIERIGRWVDIGEDVGYRTMDKNYMESILWTIKTLFDKGLLYKDYRVNPFDWKLGTVLSNSEASSDYRDVIDDAITVWFELEDGRRIMAWTTTPWTLPANSALAVNPKMKYAVMKDTDNAEYIIAESRAESYAQQFKDAVKIGEIMGNELVGLKYKPLFDYYRDFLSEKEKLNQSPITDKNLGIAAGTPIQNYNLLYQIISADYVGDDSGTGIVHIAPAFGEEDFWAAKNINPKFPVILNVDSYGNFDPTVKDFAGENIFDANPKIIAMLKQRGYLVKKENYKHSYPYGDRSKEKLIYRATDSWYIDVPKIKDALLANNDKVNWTSAGGRFADWIANARPWSISRNRFWGTPLPIWERDGEYKIFGSIKELEDFFETKINDLHRPTLDTLTKDGWKRIPDVLDCWVESGSMPWAQMHYPFENIEKFNATFPADYIIEGQDQTRGWFYALMVLSTALFDKPAFKTVSVNGMIVDEHKKKFSKSVGNFVNPEQQLEQFGADAVRLYILGSIFLKAEPLPIDKEGKVFAEPIKNIMTPLWNAYHFFTLYANAGGITAASTRGTDRTLDANILDQYIIAELNNLTGIIRESLDEYAPSVSVAAFIKFLDVLNNWYIRRSRERFWNEEQGAFDTLHFVLTEFCKLLAPFAPFISEYIFRNLTGKESVHLEEFPSRVEITKNQDELLRNMRWTQQIVSTGKQLREKYGLRNRLPLKSVTIATLISQHSYDDIIKDELNVKEVDWNYQPYEYADYFMFPIIPKIVARLGGGALKEILPKLKNDEWTRPENDYEKLLVAGYELNFDEYEHRLNIKSEITGAAIPDNTAVVVLDTTLTPELIAEGLANDALRFIQDTRKTVELDVSDRIVLEYKADAELSAALEAHRDNIMANALVTDMKTGHGKYLTEIEGHEFGITIRKA